MGVLNVTPDSFSDGGLYFKPAAALDRALRMQEEGAHIIDVGAESSRPGSKPLSSKEELKRLLPVLKLLSRRIQIPISVDTYKLECAHAALDLGVSLINDIYGLRNNKPLAKLIARYKAGVVLMHMQGTPKTMQKDPSYKNVIAEILNSLKASTKLALDCGISRSSIVIDPGFGFGKRFQDNLEMLDRFGEFSKLNYPVLAGLSRKSFIASLLGDPTVNRLHGSLAAAAVAVERGAHILRVHDVLPHWHVSAVTDALHKKRGNG